MLTRLAPLSARLDGLTARCRSGWLAVVLVLSACGGGGGGNPTAPTTDTTGNRTQQGVVEVAPMTDASAFRLLQQATFGPTPEAIALVRQQGAATWIDAQLSLQPAFRHADMVNLLTRIAQRPAGTPDQLTTSWWTAALTDPAQLRLRVAYALSQIMVVSTVSVDTLSTASYLDMLLDHGLGSYRNLIEAVTLHPAMGMYLSHMANRKADPSTGRNPDQNYAREVMQLFSIGLYQLDGAGRPVQTHGTTVDAFTQADVAGLSQVFTGWSWYRPPDITQAAWWECFWRAGPCIVDAQWTTPMSAYDNEHDTRVKRFLGVTIAPQTQASARASLQAALDRLASHPNTAPFISKQLIQKLVTSNPSDTYVRDVVQVWRATNGNLGAVVRAILLHPEARQPEQTAVPTSLYGQVREPVLRLSQMLRALAPHSQVYARQQAAGQTPFVCGTDTSDIMRTLGQTPMRSPSVFNFYRPGYAPPQGELAAKGAVAPEMQLVTDTTVLGYANFMADVLQRGWGCWLPETQSLDMQFDWAPWLALEPDASGLVDALATRLLGHAADSTLRDTLLTTLSAMPRRTADQRTARVKAAVLMLVVSPSYTVQQ